MLLGIRPHAIVRIVHPIFFPQIPTPQKYQRTSAVNVPNIDVTIACRHDFRIRRDIKDPDTAALRKIMPSQGQDAEARSILRS